MAIAQFFQNLLKKKEAPVANKYLEIRSDSFFIEPTYQEHYLKYGWCKIENAVTDKEIESFMNTFTEISKLEGFELDKNLLNSGRLFNPEIRKKTLDVIT